MDLFIPPDSRNLTLRTFLSMEEKAGIRSGFGYGYGDLTLQLTEARWRELHALLSQCFQKWDPKNAKSA